MCVRTVNIPKNNHRARTEPFVIKHHKLKIVNSNQFCNSRPTLTLHCMHYNVYCRHNVSGARQQAVQRMYTTEAILDNCFMRGVPHSRKRVPIPPVFCVILTFYGIPAIRFDSIKTTEFQESYSPPNLEKKKKKKQLQESGAFYMNVGPQHYKACILGSPVGRDFPLAASTLWKKMGRAEEEESLPVFRHIPNFFSFFLTTAEITTQPPGKNRCVYGTPAMDGLKPHHYNTVQSHVSFCYKSLSFCIPDKLDIKPLKDRDRGRYRHILDHKQPTQTPRVKTEMISAAKERK